jgi:hypothetical protein
MFNGSSSTTARGAVIAETVRLNGSSLTIEFDSSFFPQASTIAIVE